MASAMRRLSCVVQLQAITGHRIHQQMYSRLHTLLCNVVLTQKCIRFANCTANYSSVNVYHLKQNPCTGSATFHSLSSLMAKEPTEEEKTAEEQKRKLASRITLLDSEGNSMGQMKKSEAMVLAKSNNQLLIEVDSVTFKLVRRIEGVSKQSKAGSKPATKPKQLIIKSKITEHDLEVKLKHVIGWLEKEHEVFIIINNTDPSQPQRMSELLEAITNTCKHLATVKQVERTEELMRVLLKPKTDYASKGSMPPDIMKFTDMKKKNPK